MRSVDSAQAEIIAAQHLLRHDLEIYARSILKIKSESKIIPFVFRPYQSYFWHDLWLPNLLAGKPIRDIILKARQLGTSSIIEAFIDWMTTQHRNKEAMIVAHKSKAAKGLFDKLKFFNKYKPPEFRMDPKTDNREELYYEELESRIRVETAADTDLGASFTIDILHLSEFPRYEHLTDVDEMMTAVNQAVEDRPGTAIFIEGTTTEQNIGPEGKFREMWFDKENGYRKIFVSWLAHPKYRIEVPRGTYLELSGIENSRYGNEFIEAEHVKPEIIRWDKRFFDHETNPETAEALDHEIQCRIAWRRRRIDTKCEKDKNRFRREYPTTEEDAFIFSGISVFDNDILHKRRTVLIETPLESAKFSFVKDPNVAKEDWWKESFYESPDGKLEVFTPPEKGTVYVLGLDPTGGFGDDGDPASAQVIKLPACEQVARYNASVPPDEAADMAYALGMIYNEAFLIGETNGPGAGAILRLAKYLNYPNLYWREVLDSVDAQKKKKPGWFSSDAAKDLLVSIFRRELRDGRVIINSLETIRQFMEFSVILPKKKTKQRLPQYGALRGHDDEAIAFMLAVYGASQVTIPKPEDEPPYMSVAWYMKLMQDKKPKSPFAAQEFGRIRYG